MGGEVQLFDNEIGHTPLPEEVVILLGSLNRRSKDELVSSDHHDYVLDQRSLLSLTIYELNLKIVFELWYNCFHI